MKVVDELGFELIGEYEVSIGKTIVNGKCKTFGCEGTFSKRLIELETYKHPYCSDCINKIGFENVKKNTIR